MKLDDANDLAARFRGLMPKMTDEQAVAVRDMLLVVDGDVDVTWKKLLEFAARREEFNLVGARLLLLGPTEGNAARTAREQAKYRQMGIEIEREWARIDLLIMGLSPDLLEQARQGALSRMPEFLRKRNETADPRDASHRLLRGMIATWLEAGGDGRRPSD
jgi:hypothetical protein